MDNVLFNHINSPCLQKYKREISNGNEICSFHIQVVAGSVRMIRTNYKKHNPTNCVNIYPQNNNMSSSRSSSQHMFVPSLMLSNVMSLSPKIDEVREAIHHANVDSFVLRKRGFENTFTTISLKYRDIIWSEEIGRMGNMEESVCT